DVVLHASFELMDLRYVHFGASANGGSGLLRDLARFGKRFGGSQLDFEPLGKLVGIAPNVAHFLSRVAWNQLSLLSREKKNPRMFPESMIAQLESASLSGRG